MNKLMHYSYMHFAAMSYFSFWVDFLAGVSVIFVFRLADGILGRQ